MPDYATIEDYLADLPSDRREGVDVPDRGSRRPGGRRDHRVSDADVRSDGRFLVLGRVPQDYSLFPASAVVVETLGADIAPYRGKGTIRFPSDRPIPEDVSPASCGRG